MLPDDSSSESECESDADGSSCSSSSDSDVFDVIAEIKRKKAHPDRLHEELWYNDPGQVSRRKHTNLSPCPKSQYGCMKASYQILCSQIFRFALGRGHFCITA